MSFSVVAATGAPCFGRAPSCGLVDVHAKSRRAPSSGLCWFGGSKFQTARRAGDVRRRLVQAHWIRVMNLEHGAMSI